jgi:hypothetical protein
MKTFVRGFPSALILVMALFSSSSSEGAVQAQYVDRCGFYASIQGANGSSGYACSIYPSQVTVADYYSTSNDIRALQAKVMDLERRIQALERRP